MKRSPEELFVEGARQHGEGTIEGDAPATNKAYKKLIAALREIRETPDRGEGFLKHLLQNSDPSVVAWSALFLLTTNERDAVLALEKVAENAAPLISFGAEITLREWRAGRLVIE